MQGPASARVVAHNAVEDHHRAVFAALGRGNHLLRIDAIAGQRNADVRITATLLQSVRRARSTAGDRGQQAHLVAVVQNVRGLGVFGIYAYRDAAQDPCRRARGQCAAQALQQHGHGGAIRQLHGGRGGSQPILQHPKWDHLHTHHSKKNTAYRLDVAARILELAWRIRPV